MRRIPSADAALVEITINQSTFVSALSQVGSIVFARSRQPAIAEPEI